MRSHGNEHRITYIACPNCNKQMGILAHHCNQCGSPLPSPAEPADPEEQAKADAEICGKTSHFLQTLLIPAEAKFCLICGKKI